MTGTPENPWDMIAEVEMEMAVVIDLKASGQKAQTHRVIDGPVH